MKHTLSKILIFAVGAAVGSAVTYKYLKTKYDDILKEELESMREFYAEKYNDYSDEEGQEGEDAPAESDVMNDIRRTYAAIAQTNNYITKEQAAEIDNVDKPYVIDADDYGEYADYSLTNLTYFADKILADDTGEIIDNVAETVGADLWDLFPDDDDTVFIRNDKLMSDYEIQKDYRTYDEVFYISLRQTEAE